MFGEEYEAQKAKFEETNPAALSLPCHQWNNIGDSFPSYEERFNFLLNFPHPDIELKIHEAEALTANQVKAWDMWLKCGQITKEKHDQLRAKEEEQLKQRKAESSTIFDCWQCEAWKKKNKSKT